MNNKEMCIKTWEYIRDNKSLYKCDFFTDNCIEEPNSVYCYACKEAGYIKYKGHNGIYEVFNCKNCPIKWPIIFDYVDIKECLNNNNSPCEYSYYGKWEILADTISKLKYSNDFDKVDKLYKELIKTADKIVKLIKDTWK